MLVEIDKELFQSKIPKLIRIKEQPLILNKDDNGNFILYSAICPHVHGIVDEIEDDIWRCPNHNWSYDPKNGKSINSPPAYLKSFPVINKNNKFFVDLPNVEVESFSSSPRNSKGPKISLISNACLLIEWKNKTLLTDPWIEGPAVFGSWTHYPPIETKVSQLPKIDAIWISHEHSDHLHPNTLMKFDKNIPVYVPKIHDDRLGKIVKKLGFKDVNSMPSFQQFNLADTIEAISFKSASIWNDGILFLRTGNFTILNFNDAGLNLNIKNKVGNVDLVCSAFSQAASAFPSNWTNFDEITKLKMMDDRNSGVLKMLKQMVDVFNARFLLPVASFSALWHPEHLKYEKIKKRNTLKDILNYFKDEQVQILDLFPGESWDGPNEKIIRRSNRESFFDDEFRYNYIAKAFAENSPDKFIPSKFDIGHKEIKNYFMSFNDSELVRYIKQMTLCFTAYDSNKSLISLISFNNGKISYEELERPKEAEITMSCPGAMVQEIIEKNLSWDEMMYWSTFSRNSDVYNLAFWRLTHAPWRAKSEENKDLFSKPLSDISIATLVEKGGNQVLQILEQNGMYCAGCPPSVGENLQDGCSIHGVTNEKMNEILFQIQKIIKPKMI